MRGSDFAELRAFAAVVERASFARAAGHLGLSASALSQTIRQLETRLGVRLLNRTTRSVAPTPAGARLYERITPMMLELDAAVAEAMTATGRTAGTLRINALGMAVRKVIAPRLGRFYAAHPDVRLTPDVEMIAVASPDYLSRHGEPKTPAELHNHVCINWRFPGSGNLYRWQLDKKGNKTELSVTGALISNHEDVVFEGALQGLGILYAHDDDRIHEAIARGQLKRLLAGWSSTVPGLFLYYSNRRHAQPALRAFIDCLLDQDARPSLGRRRSSDGSRQRHRTGQP